MTEIAHGRQGPARYVNSSLVVVQYSVNEHTNIFAVYSFLNRRKFLLFFSLLNRRRCPYIDNDLSEQSFHISMS
jgi:hypothetical protein